MVQLSLVSCLGLQGIFGPLPEGSRQALLLVQVKGLWCPPVQGDLDNCVMDTSQLEHPAVHAWMNGVCICCSLQTTYFVVC